MATLGDRIGRRYRDALTGRTNEPVLAAGSFTQGGGGHFLLAVTDRTLYAFEHIAAPGGWIVGRALGAWAPGEVVVRFSANNLITRVSVEPADGEPMVDGEAEPSPWTGTLVRLLRSAWQAL